MRTVAAQHAKALGDLPWAPSGSDNLLDSFRNSADTVAALTKGVQQHSNMGIHSCQARSLAVDSMTATNIAAHISHVLRACFAEGIAASDPHLAVSAAVEVLRALQTQTQVPRCSDSMRPLTTASSARKLQTWPSGLQATIHHADMQQGPSV